MQKIVTTFKTNKIQKALLPESGTLSAFITVDAGELRRMDIVGNNAEITLTDLSLGEHSFALRFEFELPPNTYILATASKSNVNIVSGVNTIPFLEADYFYPDDDNDLFNNVVEIEKGSSPDDNLDRPVTPTYLTYSTMVNCGFICLKSIALGIVNPTDPSNPVNRVNVDDPATQSIEGLAITASTYDTDLKIFFDVHNKDFVYSNGDGRIQRLPLEITADLPVPIQISNETNFCGDMVYGGDFNDYNNSRIIYTRPSSGTDCNSKVWKMVTLGMNETDAPMDANSVKIALVDPNTGGQAGWLGLNTTDQSLVYYDSDFNNSSPIESGSIVDITLLGNLPDGKLIISVVRDNAGTNETKLHLFDTSNRQLVIAVHTFTQALSDKVYDNDYFFFIDNNRIFRLDLNTPGTAQLMHTETTISDISQTATNVVFISSDTTTKFVKYFPKNSNPGVTPQLAYNTTSPLTSAGTSRTRAFINELQTGITAKALFVDPDGSVTAKNNSQWIISGTIPNSFTGLYARSSLNELLETIISNFDASAFIPLEYILMAGYDPSNSNNELGGQNLSSYNAESGELAASMGTFPDTATYMNIFPTHVGPKILATTTLDDSLPDLMYVDASKAGSLVRTTNTPGVNEWGCSLGAKNRPFDAMFPILVLLSIVYFNRRRSQTRSIKHKKG